MLSKTLIACLAASASLVNAQPSEQTHTQTSTTIPVLHRIIPYSTSSSKSQETPAWTQRGNIRLQEDGSVEWLSSTSELVTLKEEDGDIYQIGLGTSSDMPGAGYQPESAEATSVDNFVSIPECHLHTLSSEAASDTITLTLPPRSRKDLTPLHLSYSVGGAQPRGCQAGERATLFNTTVKLQYMQEVDGPRLHQPIVIKYEPDGTVKKPDPEKTFLQKYWVYLVPLALVVMSSGGGGEERAGPARR